MDSSQESLVRKVGLSDNLLIVPKLTFFLVTFVLYVTYSYQMDYLTDVWRLNLNATSYISGIPAIGFFCSIAWSSLAQRTGRYKEIVIGALGLYSVCFSSLHLLSLAFREESETIRMRIAITIYGSMTVLSSALYPLIDHLILERLSSDRRFSLEMFGPQRLWVPIGQGVAGFVAGQGIRVFGYPSMFVVSAVASALFAAVVLVGFEGGGTRDSKAEWLPSKRKTDTLSALRQLMTGTFALFLLVVLIAGYSRAVVGNYLLFFLKRGLGIGEEWSGFLLLMRSIPEVACLFFSDSVQRRCGVRAMLLLGQLAGLVRVSAYAWLPLTATWSPFVFEMLRGMNNAFLTASGVRLAHDLASLDSQAIAKGFFHGIFGNLTTGLAGILGSVISDQMRRMNPAASEPAIVQTIFQVSAYASLGGLLFFALFFMLTAKGDK